MRPKTGMLILLILSMVISAAFVTGGAAAADTSYSWQWQNPVPQGNTLNNIDVLDSNHVWAVGGAGALLFYDGTKWERQESGTTDTLTGVAAISTNRVWAVGYRTSPDSEGIIRVYNGSLWQTQFQDNIRLFGVAAIDEDHAWVAADHGRVLTTDDGGTTWTIEETGIDVDLTCVFALDANHVWVGGASGTILFWNGTSWIEQNTYTSTTFSAITAADIHHVWAVDGTADIKFSDGYSADWLSQASGITSGLVGISAYDQDKVWACGDNGTILFTDNGGSSWSEQANPYSGSNGTLRSISVLDADQVWTVGDAGTILSTDDGGSSWVSDTEGTIEYLNGICAVESDCVWAVGNNGIILLYDGSTWSPQVSGTTNHLYGVSAISRTRAWAVGYGGTILSTNDGGETWSSDTSSTSNDLNGISALDENNVWAVGEDSTVQYWNGTSWQSQSIPDTGISLKAVSAANPNRRVWAAGNSRYIYNSINGAPWVQQDTNSGSSYFHGVYAQDATHAWAVGQNSNKIYFYNGSAWSPQTIPSNYVFHGVTGLDENHVWAVSDFGGIIFWDGTSWAEQTSGTDNVLNGVSATDTDHIWAVGRNGTILFGQSRHIIDSCSPTSGAQGQTMNVSIAGSNTTFVNGTSVASFGSGITVNSTTVTDATNATANITIAAGATPGTRDVNVVTGGETPEPLTGGFTVRDAKISSVNPASGTQGQTMNVSIVGSSTAFVNGTSVASFGSGVTVNSTTVSDATNATANITIAAGATPGTRDVNATTEGETPDPLTGGFTVNKMPTVDIDKIVPSYGPPGTVVTITGANFGSTRGAGKGKSGKGASYVSFNGVAATEYPKWTDTEIVCVVPQGATPGPVVVVTSAGSSSSDKTFTVSYPTWYFAEGSTDWGYDCYISIENPNTTSVTVKLTYQTKSGEVPGPQFAMAAQSQATVNPRETVGATDFSTKVECLEGNTIAADRTMTWTGPGAASPEAHNSIGVTSPEKTWYLAEGSSAWGFECWLLIQNPNPKVANCTITYMIEGTGPQAVNKQVNPNSRATFDMSKDIGEKDASIKVTSDVPVIPERAMYRNNRREGHDSIGTTTPASDYFLAEGCTGFGFTTYVLIQNPQGKPVKVDVTYMTGAGPVAAPTFAMDANSRKTINVNETTTLKDPNFSTQVHGSAPIIAERAMYWKGGPDGGEACHDSIGMATTHATFYLPDGQSSDGRETWTLVQNPNAEAVEIEVSYLPAGGGTPVFKTETIPASSRRTFNMAEHSGLNGRAAIMVTSKSAGKKIFAERAMYWNNRGAGTDTVGGYSD